MKRHLFVLAAGVLALSSCTSEGVVDDVARSTNVIGFDNVVTKLSRAEDITNAKFNQFYVFGSYNKGNANVSVFDNVLVSRLSSNDGWSYVDAANGVGAQHWVPGGKYHFYAYSCADASKLSGITTSINADGTSSFTLADYVCDAENQNDLIFAFNSGSDNTGIEGKQTGNQDVALNFTHVLSKVNAVFSSGFDKGYEMKISNVTIRNIADNGSFTYQPAAAGSDAATHVWSASRVADDANVVLWNDAEPISVTLTDDAATNSKETNSAFVIPNKYNDPNVTINFTVDLINNGESVLSGDVVGYFKPNWKPGYTYTYNITVDGDALKLGVIGFTTTVDEEGNIIPAGWGDDESSEITFK